MASFIYLWTNRAKFPVTSAKFYRAWGKRFFSFPELVRRNKKRRALVKNGATIHETAEIGGLKVDGPKQLLSVGASTFIGQAYIALHDQVQIGKKVCINDGVQILTGSHSVTEPDWRNTQAMIVIEDFVWIGTGAIILPGVRLGHGSVIGAGAVVSKSVPKSAIVVGNPAKSIQKTRCENLNYNPCEFLAENRAWLMG
jgi:maltose O-acetyltransferase